MAINNLSREKTSIFDQLQQRQADLETSQVHAESLQSQHAEIQYQLREAQDRVAILTEQLADARRDQDAYPRAPSTSHEDATSKLAAAEARYEKHLSELRKSIAAIEKERNDSEADWSRKLLAKTGENEQLHREIESSAQDHSTREETVRHLQMDITRLQNELKALQEQMVQAQRRADNIVNIEVSLDSDSTDPLADHCFEECGYGTDQRV